MAHLIEVVLKPGKRACPPGVPTNPAPLVLNARGAVPLATPAYDSRLRCAPNPDYAGVGSQGTYTTQDEASAKVGLSTIDVIYDYGFICYDLVQVLH